MATIDLGKIKLVWRGTYNNGTAYTVDDVVQYTDSGLTSSFICTTASTGNAPSTGGSVHGSWAYLAKGGVAGTDVGTTITTQGDILYRDGSGLQRLAAGTSGHFLKTQGSGANPVWAESGGKFESQLFHATAGSHNPSGSTWTKIGLDTIKTNEITSASLSSGVISLPAGTYYSHSFSSHYRTNDFNNRLQNTSDSATLLYGNGGHSWSSPNDASTPNAICVGRFTLSGTKNVEFQIINNNQNNQTAWQGGVPNHVQIWKVG